MAMAATHIMGVWRTHQMAGLFRMQRSAATLVQSVARARIAAHMLRKGIAATVALQAAARRRAAYVLATKLRAENLRRDALATVLQCAARRVAAQKRVAALKALAHIAALSGLHHAAVFVQAVVRPANSRQRACAFLISTWYHTIAAVRSPQS